MTSTSTLLTYLTQKPAIENSFVMQAICHGFKCKAKFVDSDNIEMTGKIYVLSIEIFAECHHLWRCCAITIKPGTMPDTLTVPLQMSRIP